MRSNTLVRQGRSVPETKADAIWAKPEFSVAAGTRTSVGQFGGIGRAPAHLVEFRDTANPGVPFSTTRERNSGGTGSTRSDGGDDVIGADARGDVGLGAVDDVFVAIPGRRRPQVADIGTAAGFGDGERPDQIAPQGGRTNFSISRSSPEAAIWHWMPHVNNDA